MSTAKTVPEPERRPRSALTMAEKAVYDQLPNDTWFTALQFPKVPGIVDRLDALLDAGWLDRRDVNGYSEFRKAEE